MLRPSVRSLGGLFPNGIDLAQESVRWTVSLLSWPPNEFKASKTGEMTWVGCCGTASWDWLMISCGSVGGDNPALYIYDH